MNSLEYTPRDLIGFGEHTPDPQWPGGAKIAISLVVNYEEGSELTPCNGDSVTETGCNEMGPGLVPMKDQRDVNMESIYEYGSRAGVWRILRLFDEYKVPCTCYAVGMALEKAPLVAKGRYYSDDYSDDLPHWVPYPGGKPEEGLLIVPYSLDNNDFK
ncbi:hypothetical protein RQP46_005257 [Phenoliferia psychrophenolica]